MQKAKKQTQTRNVFLYLCEFISITSVWTLAVWRTEVNGVSCLYICVYIYNVSSVFCSVFPVCNVSCWPLSGAVGPVWILLVFQVLESDWLVPLLKEDDHSASFSLFSSPRSQPEAMYSSNSRTGVGSSLRVQSVSSFLVMVISRLLLWDRPLAWRGGKPFLLKPSSPVLSQGAQFGCHCYFVLVLSIGTIFKRTILFIILATPSQTPVQRWWLRIKSILWTNTHGLPWELGEGGEILCCVLAPPRLGQNTYTKGQ